MKRIIVFFSVAVICLCFASCSAKSESTTTTTETTTLAQTTTERVTSTTAPASEDDVKAGELSADIYNSLGSEKAELSGDIAYGSFEYKKDDLDSSTLLENEPSDDVENQAKENAQKFVDAIKDNYADEIKLESFDSRQVGYGDNGIDSVIYVATYVNTQNQELMIRIDSYGEIYYVHCNFTW